MTLYGEQWSFGRPAFEIDSGTVIPGGFNGPNSQRLDELGVRFESGRWLGRVHRLDRPFQTTCEGRSTQASKLRLQIGRFIGEVAIDALTVDDMADLVAAMEEHGYKPVTIQNAYQTTKAVLDYAVRRGLLETNPARLLPAGNGRGSRAGPPAS